MSEDRNETDVRHSFNSHADDETKIKAQQALNALMNAYTEQSATLSNVLRGYTRSSSNGSDQKMADKLIVHLDQLAFHIHLQSLVCAQLDGVDTKDMATEIEKFIQDTRPPQMR